MAQEHADGDDDDDEEEEEDGPMLPAQAGVHIQAYPAVAKAHSAAAKLAADSRVKVVRKYA